MIESRRAKPHEQVTINPAAPPKRQISSAGSAFQVPRCHLLWRGLIFILFDVNCE